MSLLREFLTFNRTILELKRPDLLLYRNREMLLIEPFWN